MLKTVFYWAISPFINYCCSLIYKFMIWKFRFPKIVNFFNLCYANFLQNLFTVFATLVKKYFSSWKCFIIFEFSQVRCFAKMFKKYFEFVQNKVQNENYKVCKFPSLFYFGKNFRAIHNHMIYNFYVNQCFLFICAIFFQNRIGLSELSKKFFFPIKHFLKVYANLSPCRMLLRISQKFIST